VAYNRRFHPIRYDQRLRLLRAVACSRIPWRKSAGDLAKVGVEGSNPFARSNCRCTGRNRGGELLLLGAPRTAGFRFCCPGRPVPRVSTL